MSGGPEVAGSRSRPAAIKRLWTYFKILVALILIGFVVSKTDVPQMAALLAELSLPWLAASFVLFCMLTLIKTLQYYLLTGRQVPYARVLYVVIMQNAISNFIAGAAGIASYLTMLSIDEGVRLPRVFTSFLIVKVNDMIAVWVVMFATAVLLWPRIGVLQPVVVICLVFIVPLNLAPYLMKGKRLTARPWLYFCLIGLGYMMIEVVLIQQYTAQIPTLARVPIDPILYPVAQTHFSADSRPVLPRPRRKPARQEQESPPAGVDDTE